MPTDIFWHTSHDSLDYQAGSVNQDHGMSFQIFGTLPANHMAVYYDGDVGLEKIVLAMTKARDFMELYPGLSQLFGGWAAYPQRVNVREAIFDLDDQHLFTFGPSVRVLRHDTIIGVQTGVMDVGHLLALARRAHEVIIELESEE